MRDDVHALLRWIGAHDLPDQMVLGCAHTPFPRLGARRLGVRLPGCVAQAGLDVIVQPLAMGVPHVVVLPCSEHSEAARVKVAEWESLLTGSVTSEALRSHWWTAAGTVLELGDVPLPRRIVLGLGLRDVSALSLGQDDQDRTMAALRLLAAQGRCSLTTLAAGTPSSVPVAATSSGMGSAPALTSAPVGVDLLAEGCVACGVCVNACPTGALTLEADDTRPDLTRLVMRRDRCRSATHCVELCPQQALSLAGIPQATDVLAEPQRKLAEIVTAACERCGVRHPASDGPLCPVCAFRETSSFGSQMPPGLRMAGSDPPDARRSRWRAQEAQKAGSIP